jgi:hypothetical protein
MSEHDDGGSAFPQIYGRSYSDYSDGGMTLRDYFAGQALAGWLACPDAGGSSQVTADWQRDVAAICYALAEAMLEARK